MSSKILVKVYMSQDEKEAVKRFAKSQNKTASSLLRELVLEKAGYQQNTSTL